MSTPILDYLVWPNIQSGRVTWAAGENTLANPDGTVFAFAEQVADFLEGFAAVRRIVHFALILRLLQVLRSPGEGEAGLRRLHTLFTQANGSLRNAGAFCGQLCSMAPAAREANEVAEICQRLRARDSLSAFLGIHTGTFLQMVAVGYRPPEMPPYAEMERFDQIVLAALQSYSDADALHWFKHGRRPIEERATRMLANAVPPTLAGRLASLLMRSRLGRARAWVAQFLGALALPPRRLENQQLPLGGYSDVTTHGSVDQILPSQFALDEWDFFRRYAEREMLYFRREDPRDQTRQEMVVLLDQGVRTWGTVRLALGAALLALGKLAVLRGYAFTLATTAVDLIDPVQVEESALAKMIDASDLSPHPGLTLERVVTQPTKADRDIVLLTHPRNLREDEVMAAARCLQRGARLFALTLDRHGRAELSEIRRGIPVAIRQFRVDYSSADAIPPSPPPAPNTAAWNGVLEPIGFPFRFGLGGNIGITSFDFDLDGNYLLTSGPQGLLQVWSTTGELVEVLPRLLYEGSVLTMHGPYVLGVANGFVIAGDHNKEMIAVHYDLGTRTGTCIVVGKGLPISWTYSPAHHCVIAVRAEGGGVAVDLQTRERFDSSVGGPKSRAQEAWDAKERRLIPYRLLPVMQRMTHPATEPCVFQGPDKGIVNLFRMRESVLVHEKFTPLDDGQPMLKERYVMSAQLGGEILVMQSIREAGAPLDIRLHLFRGAAGIPVGELQSSSHMIGYRLSANGTVLARQFGRGLIEISQVSGNITPLGQTMVGGFVTELPFVLGPRHLLVQPGRISFLLDWCSDILKATFHARDRAPEVPGGISATVENVPEPCRYDTRRWRVGVRGRSNPLLAASDGFGQLAIFDRQDKLICMFFAFRTRLAGWMPDGTRFEQVTTADEEVLRHFARALQAAARRD